MWLDDYLKSLFILEGPVIQIIFFRIIFSTCCLIKFATETIRGYYNYFDKDCYLFERYKLKKHLVPFLNTEVYKLFYFIKIVAALFLFFGIFTKFSIFILLISFLIEIDIYFKFHTNLFLLICLCLLFSSNLQDGLTLSDAQIMIKENVSLTNYLDNLKSKNGNFFPNILIISTIVILYASSAYRKLNREFLSGAVIFITLQHALEERKTRKFFDTIYFNFFIKNFISAPDNILVSRWAPLMGLTIILEAFIPFGLLWEKTQSVAIVLGILMHFCFTMISPATLLHFSLLCIGSYVLFLNPENIIK